MFWRLVFIVVLGFLAFGSMLPAPFRIMDDRISIVENPAIQSAKNIPELFKEGYFHDQSYYRPLINLSFMGEYSLFGLKSFFYNLDNLLLHIVNAFLVVLLVSRLTNNATIGFWTGVLFDIHPIQWEAVCNIPGRAILLSAFFVLLSFILFFEFYKRRSGAWGLLVLISFFLGLLCKESAGVLPIVILAYLWTVKNERWIQRLVSLWPLALGVISYIFLRKLFGITNIHQASQPIEVFLGFLTFLRSVITDLRLFILPVDLHYDRSLPFMMSLGQPQALFTIGFWSLALAALSFTYRRLSAFSLFLIAWFVLELLPVSQLVTSIGVGAGHVSTADHFLYVACIPVFIALVMGFQKVYALNEEMQWVRPALFKILAGGFLVLFLVLAIEQSIYASNEFNMVKRSLLFEPQNPRLQAEMAMLSVFRNDIPDAEKHFRLAVAAEPLNPRYHIALGTALCQQGKWIEGLEQLVALDSPKEKDKAMASAQEKLTMVHIKEQLAQGQKFDAKGWLAIGIYQAKTGDSQQAVVSFLKTIKLNPLQSDAWFNLGSLYEAQGDLAHSAAAYQRILSLPTATKFQKEYAAKHLNYVGIHLRS